MLPIFESAIAFLPWLILGGSFLLMAFGVYVYKSVLWHQRAAPGPTPQLFLGNIRSFPFISGHQRGHKTYKDWFKRYGDLMQFSTLGGTLHFLISSPKLAKQMKLFPSAFPAKHTEDFKGISLEMMRNEENGLLVMPKNGMKICRIEIEGKEKEDLCLSPKRCDEFFSEYFEVIASKLEVFNNQLTSEMRHSGTAGPDLYPLLVKAAVDILGKFGFNREMGALTDPKEAIWLAVEQLDLDSLKRDTEPAWIWNFPRGRLSETIHDAICSNTLSKEMFANFCTRFTDPIFTKIRAISFEFLYDLDDEYHDRALRPHELREEVISFMSGGRETVPNLVNWTVFLLASNPQQQRSLHAELKSVLRGTLPSSVAQLSNLPFLQCVFLESLRLFPTAPLSTHHTSKPFPLASCMIPAGSRCHVFNHGMNIDPNVWENPQKFLPKRFEDEKSHGEDLCVFSRFHAFLPLFEGSFSEFGKRLALIQSLLFIVAIFQRFDVTLESSDDEIIDFCERMGPKDFVCFKFSRIE